jgi:hypothetical protein
LHSPWNIVDDFFSLKVPYLACGNIIIIYGSEDPIHCYPGFLLITGTFWRYQYIYIIINKR